MADGMNPPARQNLILLGVIYMAMASFFLPLMGTTAKILAPEHVVFQIVWARYTGHFIYMSVVFLPRHGLSLYRSTQWKVQLMRSVLLLTSTCCFFTALRYISLPTATAINFLAPIIVTALSGIMLGERVGPRRWIAVGVGFAGALVIIQPGSQSTHWAGALVVVTAFCWAL